MEDTAKIQWNVSGMDCANCALTINKYLEKQGMQDVKVNFATGDVSFLLTGDATAEKIQKGIDGLGYTVHHHKAQTNGHAGHDHDHGAGSGGFLKNNQQRFWFCLPFTLVLMLDMIPFFKHSQLMNPWVQFAICLPVFLTGMAYFGKSAFRSIRNGMPNMDVLVALGSFAAFVYSLYGTLTGQHDYIFYETAATVITLVFLGNYMEERTVQSTQAQLRKLAASQPVKANMLTYDAEHNEHIFEVDIEALRNGDLILVRSGEQVPSDCKILWGDASVNEAIITGESVPVVKHAKDMLIGGSLLVDGSVKAQVTAVGSETVLSGIINLVNEAQGEKPPVQKMADKISAVFIPVVVGIALLTLAANWIILKDFTPALMRSIAVLVIACPCAMGLATPAAIAVGLGRAARNGVLFRNATSLENFKQIKQVIFDKTGTLTTGKFSISGYKITSNNISDEDFKALVFSMEKYSKHPIAQSIAANWKPVSGSSPLPSTGPGQAWKKIDEIKGLGMEATDKEGNLYRAGSFEIAKAYTQDESHNIYITKNETLIGYIDLTDELRPEAKAVIDHLHSKGIRTVLLSGDRKAKAQAVADALGIDEVIAEQSPEDKLRIVAAKNAEQPTAMVGDGINDAPALAKATIGISMSDSSQIAMQTANVVLMNNGLKNLPLALGLGKHTYQTIKENLFWAFSYNIVAIPIAALGLLTPMFGALVMAFSDVVLAINSSRLLIKKVP